MAIADSVIPGRIPSKCSLIQKQNKLVITVRGWVMGRNVKYGVYGRGDKYDVIVVASGHLHSLCEYHL